MKSTREKKEQKMRACDDNADILVHVAEGRVHHFARCVHKERSWAEQCERMEDILRDRYYHEAFLDLEKAEQDAIKAANGWFVGGLLCSRHRSRESVVHRDLITLDVDAGDAATFAAIRSGEHPICRFELFYYTTRKHTEDHPRYRIVILAPGVPKAEFEAYARILAAEIDDTLDAIDPVSFLPSQLMFYGTAGADIEPLFGRNPGIIASSETVLDPFPLDWRDFSNLPSSPGRMKARARAEKVADPREKPGPIGAWCRLYSIHDVIEALEDVYVPAADGGDRYTYVNGSTDGAMIVYEDGLFACSYHQSDPANVDTIVNAFDLFRIHVFGDLDSPEDLESPIEQWPSTKAMFEHARADPDVKAEMFQANYDLFDDIEEEVDSEIDQDGDADPEVDIIENVPVPDRGMPPARLITRPVFESGWEKALELDSNARIKRTPANLRLILQNDKRLVGRFGFNLLSQAVVLRDDLILDCPGLPDQACRDRWNGDEWTDALDRLLRDFLSAPPGSGSQKGGWGLVVPREDLRDAIEVIARGGYAFHPWLDLHVDEHNRLHTPWDGTERNLFADYLGLPDDEYSRKLSDLFLQGIIARQFNPGHEFQFAVMIYGRQGCGKSTFGPSIVGKDFCGELTAAMKSEGDTILQMHGKVLMELPEMANFKRQESEESKAFITITHDRARLPYGRRVESHPRSCLFFGTTNVLLFLKDPSGNRRYLPVSIDVDLIDNVGITEDFAQIWAEQFEKFFTKCREHGYTEIPFRLQGKAKARAEQLQLLHMVETNEQIVASAISTYLETPRPPDQFDLLTKDRRLADKFADQFDDADDSPEPRLLALPTKVTMEQLLRESDVVHPGNPHALKHINAAMPLVRGWSRKTGVRVRGQKERTTAWVRDGSTAAEISKGYRLKEAAIDEPDAGELEELEALV